MSEAVAEAGSASTLRLTDPRPTLSVVDGVAILIGIVVGSAVFETPALVAANAGSAGNVILFWILGGVISMFGALCWAELGSTYPNAGGDYHYLTRAWGPNVGFLYAWARIAVIQTGSIALIAFVFGDYATQIVFLGPHSSAVYAAGAVVILTLLHMVGVRLSAHGQLWLTATQVLGLVLLIGAAFLLAPAAAEATTRLRPVSGGAFGLAMVFVLLTYGGWNEAAFVSGELRDPHRNMLRVLVTSIVIITSLYVILNIAMLQRLGLSGMADSRAVAADLMRVAAGERGAVLVSLLVVACALASIYAMIFTGARSAFALGRDFPLFAQLGHWRSGGGVPSNALAIQGLIILILIVFGAMRRSGFEAMVDYTAPVFWLFFLITTLSLIRLRRKDPAANRAFSVPLYPLTPILFACVCAYLLYSSVVYTGLGSFFGLATVALGIPLLLIARRRSGGSSPVTR